MSDQAWCGEPNPHGPHDYYRVGSAMSAHCSGSARAVGAPQTLVDADELQRLRDRLVTLEAENQRLREAIIKHNQQRWPLGDPLGWPTCYDIAAPHD